MSLTPIDGGARIAPLRLPTLPERAAPPRAETPITAEPGTPPPASGATFAELLRDAAATDAAAERAAQRYALGKSQDIQQTMLVLEQARIKFALLVSVRNKLLDAYREVMRMG